MMHHMEIPRVREYDAGQIRVVAKNAQGEAECSTSLLVMPREDWRARLRQAPKGKSLWWLLACGSCLVSSCLSVESPVFADTNSL